MIEVTTLSRTWFSAAEIAAEGLPGLPDARPNVARLAAKEGWDRTDKARRRAGRGGGLEYHYTLLPKVSQDALAAKYAVQAAAARPDVARQDGRPAVTDREALWAWFEQQTEARRDEGRRRVDALTRIEALRRQGLGRGAALDAVASEIDTAASTIHGWIERTRGVAKCDWLAALTPAARGGAREKTEIDERVWGAMQADYLRLSQPSFESCFRRIEQIAAEQGWPMPSARTMRRRIDAMPEAVRVLRRKGADALKRMYPAQERDRSGFHALQAVNTDGHKWDVFVRWEDGSVGRPLTVAFQDLYSGKFLAWRTAKSENRDSVRLAFGDMLAGYGIPDHCYLDNGRAFASKWLTGGTPNRYRFKVKAEEPVGIMTQLGVEIHWTTPYAGQSKPIERGFGDFARDIAKHPAFEGAYCGNSPMAKPENYGSRAIPIDEFLAVINREIGLHNARPGRTSKVCGGTLSFNQAFDESYKNSLIRFATEEQRRLCMLAAEAVLVRPLDGTIHLFGNRFFHEALWEYRGERVTVRFDPDALQAPLLVQKLDGTPICTAGLMEAAGFADTEAARTHNQARKAAIRATRELAAAENILSLDELARLQPKATPEAPREAPTIIRPAFGFSGGFAGNLALKPVAADPETEADVTDFDEALMRALRKRRPAED